MLTHAAGLFAGLVGPPGSAPGPDAVARLQQALPPCVGGRGVIVDGEVAMVCRPVQVTGTPRSNLLVAWDGLLDNRRSLDVALGTCGTSCDEDRVALGYRRWGMDVCRHLVGDYAFAVWDRTRRRLLLARDPMGVRPLFYRHSAGGRTVAWASTLRAVRAVGQDDGELDEAWIAEYLVHLTGTQRTPYRHVRAVEPGHLLVVEGGAVRSVAFWTPGWRAPEPLHDDRDYERRFAELFVEAVTCRLTGDAPVMAELSGGLDSSSIACVASGLVRAGQAPELLTMSTVFYDAPTSDERQFIRRVEKHIGRPGLHISERDGQAFEALETPDYEYPTVFECFKSRHRRSSLLMAAQGVQVLLSGFGGDNLTHSEFDAALPLADLLHARRLRAFATSAQVWHRATNTPYPPLIGSSLAQAATPTRHARRSAVAGLRGALDCLDPGFVHRTGLIEHIHEMVTVKTGPPSKRAQIAAVRLAIGTVSWMYDPGPGPHHTRYPFLHQPLVDFCLATPSEQFLRPGQTRSLHRRALRPWLPAQTAARRGKRGPDEAVHRELANNWPRLRPLLETPQLLDRQIINAAAFTDATNKARFGRPGGDLMFILKAIALEAWLAAQG